MKLNYSITEFSFQRKWWNVCLDFNFPQEKQDENHGLKISIPLPCWKRNNKGTCYFFYKVLEAYLKQCPPEFSGYKNTVLNFSDLEILENVSWSEETMQGFLTLWLLFLAAHSDPNKYPVSEALQPTPPSPFCRSEQKRSISSEVTKLGGACKDSNLMLPRQNQTWTCRHVCKAKVQVWGLHQAHVAWGTQENADFQSSKPEFLEMNFRNMSVKFPRWFWSPLVRGSPAWVNHKSQSNQRTHVFTFPQANQELAKQTKQLIQVNCTCDLTWTSPIKTL